MKLKLDQLADVLRAHAITMADRDAHQHVVIVTFDDKGSVFARGTDGQSVTETVGALVRASQSIHFMRSIMKYERDGETGEPAAQDIPQNKPEGTTIALGGKGGDGPGQPGEPGQGLNGGIGGLGGAGGAIINAGGEPGQPGKDITIDAARGTIHETQQGDK